MSAQPLLQAHTVTMRFGGVTAVKSVDFVLREGELRCLIGPNGAGKSTFFKMLTGQIHASEGTIHFRENNITRYSPYQIARLGVGIKTQIPNVFNGMTVRDNIMVGAGRKKTIHHARKITDETLSRLQLDPIADRIVGQLSHGQRQWVEIATVLAQEPDLILLDEPVAGMTHEEVSKTAQLILDINRTQAVIVVEHDMQFIKMIANIVTVFNQGSILIEDSVETGTQRPQSTGCVSWKARGMIDSNQQAACMLDVQNVYSGYGKVPILSGISLTVGHGEFVGILGHNGMGKTTLLRTLMGYIPASSGAVLLDGHVITQYSPTQRAHSGIGYVPQGREIFPNLSVLDNLRIGCLLSKKGEKETIDAILAEFPRLTKYLDRLGGALSGGEQQLLALARCLCAGPRLIFLDEPTEGIQPSIIEEMIDTLKDIGKRYSLTILLVEQNLKFISSLSERILILQKGAITAEISPQMAADRTLIDEFVGMA